jgi:hypothetical protein
MWFTTPLMPRFWCPGLWPGNSAHGP